MNPAALRLAMVWSRHAKRIPTRKKSRRGAASAIESNNGASRSGGGRRLLGRRRMNSKRLMAAAGISLAIAATATGAHADAALDECMAHPICSRMMQTMEAPDAKIGLAMLFAHVNCMAEIDLGIAASSARKMCRDIAENLAAEKKVD